MLAAQLSLKVGTLKSIGHTAPYLGLAGMCLGILDTFSGGYIGTRQGWVAIETSGIAAALLSTVAGLLVAIPAVVSHNYLHMRIEGLERELPKNVVRRCGPLLQVTQTVPLTTRLSKTSFAVIAVPALGILAAAFMTFPKLHPPKGLPIRLLKVAAPEQLSVRPIVITLATAVGSTPGNPSVVFLDAKKTPWDQLDSKIQSELNVRLQQSPIFVQGENSVYWRDVVNAIDLAEGLHRQVVLLTTTPDVAALRKSAR